MIFLYNRLQNTLIYKKKTQKKGPHSINQSPFYPILSEKSKKIDKESEFPC